MKFQHCYAPGQFFASDNPRYSLIARPFRRFCSGLKIPVILFLAIFFLPVGESIGAQHRIQMTAEVINDGLLAYRMVEHTVDGVDITSRYNGEATVPGPTIVLTEGDKVVLTIRNGLTMRPDQQVSVHTHGVHYMILSDGTLKVINKVEDEGAYPVGFYTYLWDVAAGTAGTWPYHDHNFLTHNGSEHRGLFGALIVNPASGAVTASVEGRIQSVPVDSIKKDYVLFLGDDAFWGAEIDGVSKQQTPRWTNPALTAKHGDNVRFHLIAMGTDLHQFRLRGYKWVDPGTHNLIDRANIGPLENHVFTIKSLHSADYLDRNFSNRLMGMRGDFNVTR